ncbi:MAG TPA: malto-oligosyltrehalose synthase, partial [Acidimicrobiales bacterium]|nr:malto-oligosyltrehalose synthase [Acidimicrobiales bacterium]
MGGAVQHCAPVQRRPGQSSGRTARERQPRRALDDPAPAERAHRVVSRPVRRIGATYRVQIREIGLGGAVALVPYLSALGVETLYCSPIFTARRGSTHGYDVVDPLEVDPTLGGRAGLESLLDTLARAGMNLLVDTVPNHLAIDRENAYFERALREGPSSSSGALFDIDWGDAENKVVLTVLGTPLADAIASGDVAIARDGTAIVAGERAFPLRDRVAPASRRGPPGAVAQVLNDQHYRLAFWRLRTSELNYRRFFEVDELIALRQEDPVVYATTHALVLTLAGDPRVGGLRIDHVDGLTDPAGYLERLTDDLGESGSDRPAVLVEKILGEGEALPRWPIEGTTGYEFAHLSVGVFVDPDGASTLSEEYRVRTGDLRPFRARQRDAKRRALDELFPAQITRAAGPLATVIATLHPGSDVSRSTLERALGDLICALGVYRTYGIGAAPLDGRDAALIRSALDDVVSTSEREVGRAARIVAELLIEGVVPPSDEFADGRRRFEQLAGAVMAKGTEDTALFDSGTPLVGAEVGGRPDAPAVDPGAFHEAMRARLGGPSGLNATSTHDTKRSEEVRARLAVLTEIPSQWLLTIDRWHRAHERFLGSCGLTEEIYLYETIVGLAVPGFTHTPGFRRRVVSHMEKAAREAKRRTTWSDPDVAYESDLRTMVLSVLSPRNETFHRDLARTLGKIVDPARANALGMTLLKVACPGVPDVYQGTEAGIASLTDPDNRRPVPFAVLARTLRRVDPGRVDPGRVDPGRVDPGRVD